MNREKGGLLSRVWKLLGGDDTTNCVKKFNLESQLKKVKNQKPEHNCEYYEFTFLANEKGGFSVTQSELALCVHTEPSAGKQDEQETAPGDEQSLMVVNNDNDVITFILFGGNAVIKKEMAEKYFPDIVKPLFPLSEIAGYIESGSIPEADIQKNIAEWIKIEPRKRDDYSCSSCNRSGNRIRFNYFAPIELTGGVKVYDSILFCDRCYADLRKEYKNLCERDTNKCEIKDGDSQDDVKELEEYFDGVFHYRNLIKMKLGLQ